MLRQKLRTREPYSELALLIALDCSPLAADTRASAPGAIHRGESADAVAKSLANPNNDLAKLTFRNQYRWYKGDLPGTGDQRYYRLLFQPVFPFSLTPTKSGAKQTMFLRPAIPVSFNQPTPGAVGLGGLNWNQTTAMGGL